ncbi:SusC/RagA family TonB-linked outer membrane protein [Christiangramia echinicola]|uniref:TonB-linked outer membrane protein, SusC/RagA family n=1 Tax=Christiangramia echinicola TaxID=279359 RepID=A0A1H1NWL3_9FLAO|nr:TonB-dependent receptor [Christiangramia echinicola]SDS03334.1 TonB-linked outer membrane protein, SusC/RagA family [Christiangramia echinicola]
MKKRLQGLLTLLLVLVVQIGFAQEKTVTGTVVDQDGLPLPGVNVIEKGTSNGAQTDFDGNFSISVAEGDILTLSYVGFKTQEITVGASNTIDVTMAVDAGALEEVVVVGYGSTRRELSTSAVSTISAEEIEDFVPSTSIDNIMQGQAAGVQVTAANGRPGNTAFVQIRGVGSINASTTPLYIVDGTPIDADNVANINPNDIASFSILKDAATVSKYGSRGANGVVVITTKQGKSGEAKITFRNSIGFGERIEDPFDLMNASQKLELERQYAELGVNAAQSLPGATSNEEQLAYLRSLDTNWESELLRRSYIQSNSLSVSGGDEKLSYFFSLGYDKNSGIIDRIDGFERISTRLNATYQAKDWLTVGTNISLARSSTDLPRDRNNVQNPFRGVYDYNPYEPLYVTDADGNVVNDAQGNPIFNSTSTGFPIARALTTEPENNRNFLIIGGAYADVKFSDKFSNRFSVNATSNRFNRTTRSIAGGVLQGFVGDANFPGTQTDNYSLDFEYNVNNLLSYRDSFGLHNIGADFLLEYNENIYTDLFATSRGFPSPDIPYQDVAAEATAAGSEERRRILFSQGLFLDYNYDEKYILSGSIRRDGSSRFAPNNKYGYFYSGSAAWNLAKEDFLQGTFVDDLKLRASYGTSGNQNIGNFAYLDLLQFNTYNGFTTAIPVGVGNPDVQWESQAILDIGVEFALFNNRVSGVVDYFKKNSRDLLLDRPISQTVGDENNSITANIGEIENSGVEVSLKADVIRNADFIWTVGGNASFLDNEVVSLVDGEDIPNGTTRLREGEGVYSFFLVRYAGVNPANGQPLYYDVDDNLTSEYSSADAVLLEDKSPFADLEGGFYTSLKYKGFGLRGDFVFKKGNYILNYQRSSGIEIGSINSNQRVEAFNYWKEPGDQNVLPSPLFADTADQTSTRFLESGDYIRLRTLTIDYRVPSEFLSQFSLDGLRLYATGQNLLTWTDYNGDPEIGLGSAETAEAGDQGFVPGEFSLFSYPQTKSYTFGVEISF